MGKAPASRTHSKRFAPEHAMVNELAPAFGVRRACSRFFVADDAPWEKRRQAARTPNASRPSTPWVNELAPAFGVRRACSRFFVADDAPWEKRRQAARTPNASR